MSGARLVTRNRISALVYVRLFVVFRKIDSYSYFPTALVRTVPKRVQVFFLILVRILCLFLFWRVLLALGLLFMDELQRAVSQFYPASGGMAGSSGGSSGGPGWTSFDLGVLEEENHNEEEVSQPQNAPANPAVSPGEEAGPSKRQDCWTGQPDEKLLRAMDKKLTLINKEGQALAKKAVQKAAEWKLGLPGSATEQEKSIWTILDNRLDDLDVTKQLRQVRKWSSQELFDPESTFWLLILEEISKV